MYPHPFDFYRLDDVGDRRHLRYQVSSADTFRGPRIVVVICLAWLTFTLVSLAALYRFSANLANQAQPRPSVVNEATGLAFPAPDAEPGWMLQDPGYWGTVDVPYQSNRGLLSTGAIPFNVFRPLPAGPY